VSILPLLVNNKTKAKMRRFSFDDINNNSQIKRYDSSAAT